MSESPYQDRRCMTGQPHQDANDLPSTSGEPVPTLSELLLAIPQDGEEFERLSLQPRPFDDDA